MIWSRLAGEDSQIRIFLTGSQTDSDSTGSSTGSSDDVELDQLEKEGQRTAAVPPKTRTRTDLQKIVDEFLGHPNII